MKIDEKGYEVLTVTELIAELQKMPPEALVYHEGCDCTGNAHRVLLEADGTVMITRTPSAYYDS